MASPEDQRERETFRSMNLLSPTTRIDGVARGPEGERESARARKTHPGGRCAMATCAEACCRVVVVVVVVVDDVVVAAAARSA